MFLWCLCFSLWVCVVFYASCVHFGALMCLLFCCCLSFAGSFDFSLFFFVFACCVFVVVRGSRFFSSLVSFSLCCSRRRLRL